MDNQWIQLAIEALIATHIADKQEGTCSRTYRRNISSLGASIVQMGLCPALFSFSRTDGKAGNEPHLIIEALKYMIVKSKSIPDLKDKDDLAVYAFNHKEDARLLRVINRALIALKSAIRLFRETDRSIQADTQEQGQNYFKADPNKKDEIPTMDELNKTEKVNNMGWYFTRRYYRDLILPPHSVKVPYYQKNGEKKYRDMGSSLETNYRKYNRSLFGTSLRDEWKDSNTTLIASLGCETFRLSTTYPGLLVGTGLHHGTGGVKNDLKMGFQFDYTTGLPYIPGSSLKGVLRSMFPENKDDARRCKYIRSLLPDTLKGLTDEGIVTLKKDIFEQGKDIFFDALIVDSKAPDKRIMGEDYITPHREALKNPVPLQIIKVLPCVVFSFPFRLKDCLIEGKKVKATDKKVLFRKILLEIGVGAKTNTGYGQFVEEDKSDTIAGWTIKKETEDNSRNRNGNPHGNGYWNNNRKDNNRNRNGRF